MMVSPMHGHVVCFVALLAICSVAIAVNTEPGRLGCYEDRDGAVWKQWSNTHEKNTATFCKNMCQDYKFAGVEQGSWCSCGDVILPTTLPDSRCSTPCSGDANQTCGGQGWVLEVFEVEPKPDVKGHPMGCFQDTSDRVWKTGLIKLGSNSPQRCFNACRGFRFAGLEAGAWCMCGDHLPPTQLANSSCQMECAGYVGKKCGGNWALEVFELSETPETVQVVGCIEQEYKHQGEMGIYKFYVQRKTWDEAWQQCEEDDAHLLIINSEEEAEFVRGLFAQVPSEKRMHAGFHDLLRKGMYRTVFGVALSSTGYTKWSEQYAQVPSAVQHCGSVDVQAQLAQIDGNCGTKAVFVCEKKSDSPDANGQVPVIDVRGSLASPTQ